MLKTERLLQYFKQSSNKKNILKEKNKNHLCRKILTKIISFQKCNNYSSVKHEAASYMTQ